MKDNISKTLYFCRNLDINYDTPGVSKFFTAKAELVGYCSEEDFDKLSIIHKMRRDVVTEKTEIENNEYILFDRTGGKRYKWGQIFLAYDKANEYSKSKKENLLLYKITKRNFANPNFDKIIKKRKKSLAEKRKIVSNIPILEKLTNNVAVLDRKTIREIINQQLIEKGYKPLTKNVRIHIYDHFTDY